MLYKSRGSLPKTVNKLPQILDFRKNVTIKSSAKYI